MTKNEEHKKWMKLAFREAEKAYERGEIPIGAVVVKNDQIIGRGYNQCESLNDPTAHAEIIGISSAANTIKNWRLAKRPSASCVLTASEPREIQSPKRAATD